MKINEGYKLGVKVLRKYYLKLRCPEEKMKPLLKLGKLERMVLNNSDGELLKVTKLENHPIKYLDAYGLLHSYKELFEENIYFFESENKAPTIIDCGSNVGLSIIYFKMLFPASTVVGFEPDPTLFKLLEANLESFHFTNVEVRNEAVWNKNEYLRFETDPSLVGML